MLEREWIRTAIDRRKNREREMGKSVTAEIVVQFGPHEGSRLVDDVATSFNGRTENRSVGQYHISHRKKKSSVRCSAIILSAVHL